MVLSLNTHFHVDTNDMDEMITERDLHFGILLMAVMIVYLLWFNIDDAFDLFSHHGEIDEEGSEREERERWVGLARG